MTQDHPFLNEIPAYAVGALDPDRAMALESHLQTCEICRAELAAYQPVIENLLQTTSPKQPPARLRREMQRHLPNSQKGLRPHFVWSFSRLVAGIVIVLLVVLNILLITQVRALRRQQAELLRKADTSQAALALLASTGTKSIAINTGDVTGTILLNQARDSALMLLWNLPELQGDQTYQAWLIDSSGHRTSAGIFEADTGLPYTSKPIFSSKPFSNYVGLGVTIEPAGGSQQPTGQRIFKVDF